MHTIEKLYQLFSHSRGVSTDTREDLADKIFFALRGERFDGNQYARDALNAGARAAVVDHTDLKQVQGCLYFKNSLTTLQRLANFHRNQFDIPVVGITGTNGKTTTKELIVSVLSEKYKVCSTRGNLNNHIGVPLTLLQMSSSDEVAVIEMGANHPGEIGWLCQIAAPNLGLVTNVGKAHLQGFGGIENIWRTKMDLYRYLDSHSGSLMINRNEPSLEPLKDISFTNAFRFDRTHLIQPYRSVDFSTSNQTIEVELHTVLGTYSCSVALYGEHNINNILCALAIGAKLGMEPEEICRGLQNYRSKLNRSEVVVKDSNTYFLDAYNANPTSMRLALEFFEKVIADNKVLILGDMFELGEDALSFHQEVVDQVLGMSLSGVLLVGEQFGNCRIDQPGLFVRKFENTKAVIEYLSGTAYQNTHFLIKGSRSMKLETLVQ
ncbi:MAG: UDP-N-acetylmuramoyl-tripeptide--D-alanyl-D-alanine ligase [Saprospiraceae bacterium]|nr:UDP-N-acetylmuramoyl-tripeptide--D-alanyl-D-alanine ligase [Saprospiraceae bacterium]